MDAMDIKQALGQTSTTFAGVKYTSEVKLAAKNKHIKAHKEVEANVTLFNKLNDYGVYARAVMKRSSSELEPTEFKTNETYFKHTDCFSIVEHKTNGRQYLYCIMNRIKSSTYYIDGELATKEEVMELVTPSVRKQMEQGSTTYNKTNDVTHNLVLRTIALENIKELNVNKHKLK